ncbi:MAG: type II CAAX prenyl endopeptidase Rce1 family protein [Haloferacaceae archaeon]
MLGRLLVPVWNASERRLRAPWRLLLFAAALALVGAGGAFALRNAPPALVASVSRVVPPDALASPAVRLAVGYVVGAVVLTALTVLAAVAVDRRPVSDYGLALDRDWWLDCGFGLALGAALMTLVFAVEYAAGWVTVAGRFRTSGPLAFAEAFLTAVVLTVAVGFAEELLVRGYVLTNVAEGFRAFGDRAAVAVAVLASSALFGVLHATNPNATAASTVALGLGGVLLALGYVLTGDLAIPIGLHVTWNLFQGPVYGFPVSGGDLGVSVLVVTQRGPPVATGGAFGPEAGLVGIGAIVLGAVAIAAYVRRRYGSLSLAPLAVPRLRWWRWARPTERADGARGTVEGPGDGPD